MPDDYYVSQYSGEEIDALLGKAGSSVQVACNPNLLDNWYFGNPVNQRGQTEYKNPGYSIDRWFLNNASGKIGSDGISLTASVYDNNFAQKIEPALWSALVGKRLNISILIKSIDGIWAVASGNNQIWGKMETAGLHSFSAVLSESATEAHRFFSLGGEAGKNITIGAIKLELGDRQTLAHQDASGNWLLNEIPDYGEQSRRCQRYYRQFNAYTKLIAQYIDGNRVVFVLPDSMRVAPVMSGAWRIYTGVSEQSGFTLNTQQTGNIIVVEAVKANHGLQSAWLGVDVAGVGELHADL